MTAHALKGLIGEIGSGRGEIGESNDKVYPKMSTTLQVKDTTITIKQIRRTVFGWSGDLEHLNKRFRSICYYL